MFTILVWQNLPEQHFVTVCVCLCAHTHIRAHAHVCVCVVSDILKKHVPILALQPVSFQLTRLAYLDYILYYDLCVCV